MTRNETTKHSAPPAKKRGDLILTVIIVLIVTFLFAWNIFSYYAPQWELSGKKIVSIHGVFPDTEKRGVMAIKGRYAVLNFWGTWCSSCVAELPELKKVATAIPVYGVLKSPYRRGALRELDVTWPQIIGDDSLFKQYHISGVPTTLLLKDGVVDKVVSGVITEQAVKAWLSELQQR